MIPSGDETWQWKSASIRKMVLMGKSSINMGFSIAMFDYGGY
jgi:alpha-glucosidase (family GH31 glycosyl hydrolase)